MDFTTTVSAPVTIITINGTEYKIPHFLLPDQIEWMAKRRNTEIDEATKHLDKDQKARFLAYFPIRPVDIWVVSDLARSPEGTQYVIRTMFKKAGVPDNVTTAVLQQSDPNLLRKLADELCSASAAGSAATQMTEKSADPLPEQPDGSSGSVGTGPQSTPDSAPATQA